MSSPSGACGRGRRADVEAEGLGAVAPGERGDGAAAPGDGTGKGGGGEKPPPPNGYFSQASTFERFASTHFFAAASGFILSFAMYFATRFWSSLVQLKFFTRL